MNLNPSEKILVCVDRGGTFTDICAFQGERAIYKKILSENPGHYEDSLQEAFRLIQIEFPKSSPEDFVFRVGTTIATNALLERKGTHFALVVPKGLGDVFKIGTQTRPRLFDMNIPEVDPLYESVFEIPCRQTRQNGNILSLVEPDFIEIRRILKEILDRGLSNLCVALPFAHLAPQFEAQIEDIALSLGFSQVFLSSKILPLSGYLRRGNSSILQAYVDPGLKNYLGTFLTKSRLAPNQFQCLKSNGRLCPSQDFRGIDSLLSGPAGGVCASAGLFYSGTPLLNFDMGGTSTDVSRYDSRPEIIEEISIDNSPYAVNQLEILTVASGGGSIISFQNGLIQIGPESAGAIPGPACYGLGGPPTITDANLLLGRLQINTLPRCFGPERDQPVNLQAAKLAMKPLFEEFRSQLPSPRNSTLTLEKFCETVLELANEIMSGPIKEVSVEKGFEPASHHLVSYGGAGGLHACQVAILLNIPRVLIHPGASLFSALGMSFANETVSKLFPLSIRLEEIQCELESRLAEFSELTMEKYQKEINENKSPHVRFEFLVKLENTNQVLRLDLKKPFGIEEEFLRVFSRRFGFTPDLDRYPLVLEAVEVHCTSALEFHLPSISYSKVKPSSRTVQVHENGHWHSCHQINLSQLKKLKDFKGPGLIEIEGSTIFVPEGFQAQMLLNGVIQIDFKKVQPQSSLAQNSSLFFHRFTLLCEKMGRLLSKTARSTNIRDRFDFSCALFNAKGDLIANAPHIPVHLGSMSCVVKEILKLQLKVDEGSCLVFNSPELGGTHLPDITAISPVFSRGAIKGFVASRGHHADIGGVEPGSMPSYSKKLSEEGALFSGLSIAKNSVLEMDEAREIFQNAGARQIRDNLYDLQAQWQANELGISQLKQYFEDFGEQSCLAAMNELIEISAFYSRQFLKTALDVPRECTDYLDDGSKIHLKAWKDPASELFHFDFTASSDQVLSNHNAPEAITRSALVYCLRSIIEKDLPLNEGFLKPVKIHLRPGSILKPRPGIAVCSGNVLTSQRIVDVILKAFEYCADSQGCMNNLLFGNETLAFYETIGGGSGALPSFPGKDGVHTHLTNTRVTDLESLENAYPVLLTEFSIRRGSGGIGLKNGGNGLIRELEFLEPMRVNILTERRELAPRGIQGGQDGKPGRNFHILNTGEKIRCASRESLMVEAGERIRIETPGGGAYGRKQ